MQISLLFVNPQVRKLWLPGSPKNCSAWNQCSEGKENSFLESVSSFIKGFLESRCFVGKSKQQKSQNLLFIWCRLQSEGRVDIHLSHQPLLSISRGVMKQVLCLRFSSHWLSTSQLLTSFPKELSSHCDYYAQVFKRFQQTECWGPLKIS